MSYLILATLMVSAYSLRQQFGEKCKSPLGMKNGDIKDSSIRASSSYNYDNVGPQMARLEQDIEGGAWCPKGPIRSTSYQWLEVTLPSLTLITMIETQGRYGNDQGMEYPKHYYIQYQRTVSEDDWIRFKNYEGKDIFAGNMDTNGIQRRKINPPIVALRVRIIPYSVYPDTICLRMELFGCPWNNGILYYELPNGDFRGDLDLTDTYYDNDRVFSEQTSESGPVSHKSYRKRLTGGLGKLTDGRLGVRNFKKTSIAVPGLKTKVYDWIGWKEDLTRDYKRKYIDISIYFNTIRSISSIRLYCNNLYSKNIRVFKKANIYASTKEMDPNSPLEVGNRKHNKTFLYIRDTLMESPRYAIVWSERLSKRLQARWIVMRLFFDDRWMMISEIEIKSEIYDFAANTKKKKVPTATLR